MIYVIRASFGPVKVGRARCPEARLRTLVNCQPYTAEVVYTHEVPARLEAWIERRAHELLSAFRIRGEWFDTPVPEAEAAIKKAVGESQAQSLVGSRTEQALIDELTSPQVEPGPAYLS